MAREAAAIEFIQVEAQWEGFREEFMGDNLSAQNYVKLRDWLKAHPQTQLDPAAILAARDAALIERLADEINIYIDPKDDIVKTNFTELAQRAREGKL